MLIQSLTIVLSIVLVDLALSGDNALVIGAAASTLPPEQRRTAILVGGFGAIVLRILLTVGAVFLLQIPLLQAIGGAILFFIAARLLYERYGREGKESGKNNAKTSANNERRLLSALATIVVADATMSLDNVLANAALAVGHIPLLVAGLLLSIGIVLAGSALVASLMNRLPWLLDLAALVLGWVGAGMIINDTRINTLWPQTRPLDTPAIVVGLVVILAVDVAIRMLAHRQEAKVLP